ncbi:MAG TPA: 2-amino-4-hydroxy-6-hydroxymethyldihydropteridine diphosphokinase [Silvibacterium sp.]|nr:2-amino-4-hydroxy-6-hydroxymethyldihydropteridine diphosphokinase [Silvibacterium sp.]
MSEIAYLSLGSNVGERQKHLREAIALLGGSERVLRVSSFYETEPVEVAPQGWFLNCAAAIETEKTPQELMTELLRIEQDMGRRRLQPKGPRIIDIDILLSGESVIDSPGVVVPHPAMHRRRFVLEPLAEIAPEAQHPTLKKTVRELLSSLPAGQVVRRLLSS